MKITCPVCGAGLPARQINIQAAMAQCVACNHVFGLGGIVPGTSSAQSAAKPQVNMPKGFSKGYEGTALTLTRRWYSPKWFGLLFFCVFWDGFLLVWYTLALTENAPLAFLLFPLIHLAVGVALTYTCLAGFINNTSVKVNPGTLTVSHYPLPWPGAGQWPRAELEQLYCKKKISHGKHGPRISYEVSLVTRNGKPISLITGLETWDQARYIEQEVEQYLGIEDRAMAEEHSLR